MCSRSSQTGSEMGGLVYLCMWAIICQVALGESFSYGKNAHNGPSHWAEGTQCGSTVRQSPIDVVKRRVTGNTPFKLSFECLNRQESPAVLSNNGHTITADVAPGCTTSVDGVPEFKSGLFNLLSFHFHFSDDNNHGSEHEVNGHAFPAEMHLVHMNKRYTSITEASQHSDGLAVIGVLFKLSAVGHPEIEKIIQKARSLETTVSPKQNLQLDLSRIVGRSLTNKFFTYSGSLTTPPCTEVVQWFIRKRKLPITQAQLNILRELRTGALPTTPLICTDGNCRAVQPLNGRHVYSNF